MSYTKIGEPVVLPVDEMPEERSSCLKLMYEDLMKDLGTYDRYSSESIARLLDWLDNTDFYTAPASTKFHDSYECGLLYHHLRTYNEIIELKKLNKFKSVPIESASLVALTHDLCKIGLYEKYMRNVKDEETGAWEQVPAWRYYKQQFPFGHGASSMWLVNNFLNLSIDEALAIRWHMGEYNCATTEIGELNDARDEYPLVLLLQTADRFAITGY